MFASNRCSRATRPAVRVPYVALASREHGAQVAEASVQAAVAVAVAVRAEEEVAANAEARAKVPGGARAAILQVGAAASQAGVLVLQLPRQPQMWEKTEPGITLAGRLERVESAECDDYELVEVIAAYERQKAHISALQASAMAQLAGREIYAACAPEPENGCVQHDAAKAAAQEVSAALRWTPGHAVQQVYQSVTLEQECHATLAALSRGEIDAYRARIIVEETAPLAHAPEARARAEAEVLEVAGDKTGPQVRAFAKRRVLAADPEVAERRREQARRERHVTKPRPEPDGMACVSMVGPAEDVAAFYTALDAAARARKAEPGEERNLEQLRFDVLADIGWSGLEAGHIGCCSSTCPGGHRTASQQGRAAAVHVTVPFSTLAGAGNEPAELEGYGPITPEAARAIAAHGTLRRLITDPATGRLLEFGQTRYEPPRHLVGHVIARDRTCRFPTCNWRAGACDIDHTLAYHEGGPTSETNLEPLHRWHHNGKTHHGWQLIQPEPGRFVWISPAGHVHHVHPEAVGSIVAGDHSLGNDSPLTSGSSPPGSDSGLPGGGSPGASSPSGGSGPPGGGSSLSSRLEPVPF